MTIKINTKVIGIKGPIEVKPTVGLKEEANNIMISLIEMSMVEEKIEPEVDYESLTAEEKEQYDREEMKKTIANIKKEQSTFNGLLDFIQSTLKLSASQIKKVKYEISESELGEFINYLVQRINGKSDADIELAQKIEVEKQKEQDPKKL
ncbi:phage tail tube assembly chaperone [Pediococcus pentosaceus]|uniref:phage tail tube assembly chaperone n=1 Tax=Pediococcus pentosaceus TaxID=1255 RepID=UPI0013E8DF50|nr:phage tail tube assembly chaperone [Pediococcus pentosaceus]